ncbi:MAG: hypothetical protein ACE5LS_03825 [Thermoplasmata archaeon]
MLDRYGTAVVEERRHDRRLACLEDYLRSEYGSADGMQRYLAEANHNPSPRSGLRAFLAKIARVVAGPRIQAATPAASVEGVLSEDCTEHAASAALVAPALRARPVGFRERLNVRPRNVLPPPRR